MQKIALVPARVHCSRAHLPRVRSLLADGGGDHRHAYGENIVVGVALDDDDPGLGDALHVRATGTKTITDFGRFSGFLAWAIA